ncbi:hypothetical protein DSO57_1035737, partial [Entomophthora muscae]
ILLPPLTPPEHLPDKDITTPITWISLLGLVDIQASYKNLHNNFTQVVPST